MKTVVTLAQRQETDLDLFYFSGKSGSGILLPAIDKWPGGNTSFGGYTFMAWFKLDNKKPSGDKIVLWSMRSEHNDGVEIQVENSVLSLVVVKKAVRHVLSASDLKLIGGR
jgi:hypothetical protein